MTSIGSKEEIELLCPWGEHCSSTTDKRTGTMHVGYTAKKHPEAGKQGRMWLDLHVKLF